MNIPQLKDDIFDGDHPERQYKAAYQMRYVQNDPEVVYTLFRACYEAKDPKLQQEAVRSLGVLKPEQQFPPITLQILFLPYVEKSWMFSQHVVVSNADFLIRKAFLGRKKDKRISS